MRKMTGRISIRPLFNPFVYGGYLFGGRGKPVFWSNTNRPRWVSGSEPDPDGALCLPEEEKNEKQREALVSFGKE
jgi:hypothetical protein